MVRHLQREKITYDIFDLNIKNFLTLNGFLNAGYCILLQNFSVTRLHAWSNGVSGNILSHIIPHNCVGLHWLHRIIIHGS